VVCLSKAGKLSERRERRKAKKGVPEKSRIFHAPTHPPTQGDFPRTGGWTITVIRGKAGDEGVKESCRITDGTDARGDQFMPNSNNKTLFHHESFWSALEMYGEQVVRVFPTREAAEGYIQRKAEEAYRTRPEVCNDCTLASYVKEWSVWETVVSMDAIAKLKG